MTRRGYVLCGIAAAILWLAGCASPRERDAFAQWRRLAVSADQELRGEATASEPVQLTEASSLEDYLAYAGLNNPGLEAAFNRWKAALERVPQARALPDPRFTYRHYIREVETRVGPQRNSYELSQMFPWIGKLDARGDAALEAALASREQYEAEKLKLFRRVKDAYYEYAYWSRAVTITRENRDLLSYLEDVVQARYKVAEARHPDLVRVQVELARLEDRLRTILDLRTAIVARLNAALGRSATAAVPPPGSIPGKSLAATDAQVFAWLAEGNPELRALAHDMAREEKAIELAALAYLPDVTLGVNYIDTGTALMRGTPDSGKDPVLAMVSVNLPIWYEKLGAAEREARARYLAAAKRKEDRGNALEAETQLVLYRLRDAERRIDLYRDTLLPKGEQSLKASETAYQGGKAAFLDLLDAQRVLLDFQLGYERARADHAQKLAELEALVGRPLPLAPADSGNAPEGSLETPAAPSE